MARPDTDHTSKQWDLLRVYRDRYKMDHLLDQVNSLERSIKRRRDKLRAARRRVEELEGMLDEARAQFDAATTEITGSRAMGALLIEDILDQVRTENGERWSPMPVRGFRVWRVQSDAIWGNQVAWREPNLSSRCLRSVPGEDIPHSVGRCGPPACGIYAVKSLDMFPQGVANCQMTDMAIGVVAMTGKVVEHELGYRAQRASVVAMAAHLDNRRLVTDRDSEIDALFRNPKQAIERLDTNEVSSPDEARAFLETAQQENTWT